MTTTTTPPIDDTDSPPFDGDQPVLRDPSCPLRALGWKTIVQRFTAEAKIGSIFLPDESKEAPLCGKVLAVSENIHRAYGLRVGDIVLFPRHGGYVSTFDGTDYLTLDRESLLAVVVQE